MSPVTLPGGITPAGEDTAVFQEPVVELHEESGSMDTPVVEETIEQIISDVEKERRDLRAAYPQFAMQFDVIDAAIEAAASKMEKDAIPSYAEVVLMSAVDTNIRERMESIPLTIVDPIVATDAKMAAVAEMVKIQAGRNISDIPLNDEYWAAQNRMHQIP